jgi:hypothetical protein
LEDDLILRLRYLALDERTSMSALIRKAVVDAYPKKRRKRKQPEEEVQS